MKKIDFAIKVDGLMWWGKAVKPVSNDGLTCALQQTAPIMIRYTFVVWRGYIGRNYTRVETESSHACHLAPMSVRPLVLSGPSGVGKSTLLQRLFLEFPDSFGFSVSRAPYFFKFAFRSFIKYL